jgi:antitoxin component YwqK of YwqJK toxin-antitoxin module
MRIIFIFILFFALQTTVFGMCTEDGRTLTEFLYSSETKTIFSCKVISITVKKSDYEYSCGGGIDGTAIVEIINVYFGNVDTNIVTLKTGSYLKVNSSYIIYAHNNDRRVFSCGGNCPNRTHEINGTPKDSNELNILNQFSEIYKNKKSGIFTFLSHDKKILATGEFKDGVPIKNWKHYYDSGVLKYERNSKTKHTKYYNVKGFILVDKKEYRYRIVDLVYSEKNSLQLEYKWVHFPNNDGQVSYLYEYYPNCNLKLYARSIYIKSKGTYFNNGVYKEGYENGKIKAKGQMLDGKPVGLWKWYNEKGHRTKKFDYKDGTIVPENTEKIIN